MTHTCILNAHMLQYLAWSGDLREKELPRVKNVNISTKLEPQILPILPAKAWGFLKKLVVHKKEKPTPFRLPWEVSQAAFPSVEYKKPGRPCRLLPLESRPRHWKKSPWGPSLPGLTYLDVICLVRMGMELMGMDKKTGLGWPKGDELTGLGSKRLWGKVSPEEKYLLNLDTQCPA